MITKEEISKKYGLSFHDKEASDRVYGAMNEYAIEVLTELNKSLYDEMGRDDLSTENLDEDKCIDNWNKTSCGIIIQKIISELKESKPNP